MGSAAIRPKAPKALPLKYSGSSKAFLHTTSTPAMAAGRQACRRLARSSNARHPLLTNPSSSVLARKYRRRQNQSLRPLVRAFSALDLNGSPGARRISTIVTHRSKCARVSPFDRRCGLTPAIIATTSPLQKYHTMVETGALRPDDHQTKIIQILQDLYNRLLEYSPPSSPIVTETKSFVRLHLSPVWPGLDLIPDS